MLAFEGLACPAMRAAAHGSRANRWVARRASERDQIIGSPLVRGTGSKRGFPLLRARSRCVARRQPSVRLRANETLQLTGAPSIAVEWLDTDTLINLWRAW